MKYFDSDPNIARRQKNAAIEEAEKQADKVIQEQQRIAAIDRKYIVKEWKCPKCDKVHEVFGPQMQIGGLYPTERHCKHWREINKEMERGKRIWELKGIWRVSRETALRYL